MRLMDRGGWYADAYAKQHQSKSVATQRQDMAFRQALKARRMKLLEKPFLETAIIAEVGVNHEGNVDAALKMVAWAAGADAVTFNLRLTFISIR